MILVTRLDRQVMLLNPDHIISIEETPDTVITLYNGHHILVRERSRVLLNRIVAFRTRVLRQASAAWQRPKYCSRSRLSLYTPPHGAAHQPESRDGLLPLHHQDV
ncbi:flagellar FlbD family protein [Trichlorobacter ammonificans]|uniref:Flagellar protein FlbD n=1 Tax=Trichlorobacter ammonificans TaxID=2916410 RepID=A0ABM9D516_9BACT|nr:flagellar FlbD family protein [Trichlorobacter ammonificans]CAH2030311.1 Flagellar protein FlbD [Trichlorobacter ammonificans]